MPGVPGTGAGQRAEPHVRMRPRRVEPDACVAARPVLRLRAGEDELRPGERLPDCHENHRRTGVAERGVLGPASAGDPAPASRVRQLLVGRARYPRYKSRTGRQSAEFTRSGFRYRDGALFLTKMDTPLAFAWSWPGIDPASIDPSTVTVSRDPCGRWYVSFAAGAADPEQLPAVNARGRGPGHQGLRRHLRRREDRQPPPTGPPGTEPGPLPAASVPLPARVREPGQGEGKGCPRAPGRSRAARADFLHKASTRLVRAHDVIVIEDLAVKNMVRNRKLAKAISDCGWGTFRATAEYKAARYGRHVITADRWYPSSKTCSACGHLLADLSLNTRTWQCPSCGTRHDRDINAAKNILAAGRAVAGDNPGHACGADVRPQGDPLRRSAVKQEPRPVRAGIPVLQGEE